MQDALSVSGFLLTLAGLIGSFFAIHISDWLRDILAISTKANRYKHNTSQEETFALYDIEYEVERLQNNVIYIVSLTVIAFMVICVSAILFLVISAWDCSVEAYVILIATLIFGTTFTGLYIYMLKRGRRAVADVSETVRQALDKRRR